MRSSISDYPPDWPDISFHVRTSRNYTCEGCGQIGNRKNNVLTVHHVNYDPSDNREDNLLLLCQKCHLALQQGNPPHLIRLRQGQLPLMEVIHDA
jgi:5-methylcytosine-specific restriction endonuclease McrA